MRYAIQVGGALSGGFVNKRRTVFFTADWHLGHKNIIRFDKRPFKDVSHMHEVLINNYNSTVLPDSVCYFLGDMGLCGSGCLARVLQRLQGTKILIVGNHDKGVNAMYSLGFSAVLHGAYLWIANEQVSLTHCPLRKTFREDTTGMSGAGAGEAWHGENRHQRFSIVDRGQFHLHGHVHSKPENRLLGRQFDVGVRANDYRPVSISAIESWISTAKRGGSVGPRRQGH